MQPRWPHFLRPTLTIPSRACWTQNSGVLLPSAPKLGHLEQPRWPHLLPAIVSVEQSPVVLKLSAPNNNCFTCIIYVAASPLVTSTMIELYSRTKADRWCTNLSWELSGLILSARRASNKFTSPQNAMRGWIPLHNNTCTAVCTRRLAAQLTRPASPLL